jgi:hypothetical protein
LVAAWRPDRADTLADRTWDAFAAENLDPRRCGPVIDLPQAVAARADLVAARPGQHALLRPSAGGGATRHGGILADHRPEVTKRCPENAGRSRQIAFHQCIHSCEPRDSSDQRCHPHPMGKRRAKRPFEDNPVIDGEWMDAPEGQQSIEALDLCSTTGTCRRRR